MSSLITGTSAAWLCITCSDHRRNAFHDVPPLTKAARSGKLDKFIGVASGASAAAAALSG
jgi:hypothetical protein